MYELPENSTDVPKHVGLLKDHTFGYVCNLCIDLVLQMNEQARTESNSCFKNTLTMALLEQIYYILGLL